MAALKPTVPKAVISCLFVFLFAVLIMLWIVFLSLSLRHANPCLPCFVWSIVLSCWTHISTSMCIRRNGLSLPMCFFMAYDLHQYLDLMVLYSFVFTFERNSCCHWSFTHRLLNHLQYLYYMTSIDFSVFLAIFRDVITHSWSYIKHLCLFS